MFKFFKRPPDFVIGSVDNPYLLRWWLIPKNNVFNIYLHKFCRSDDDRALHDHPWSWNISLLLKGSYIEHMPGGRKIRKVGVPVFRLGTTPHRVELFKKYSFALGQKPVGHEQPVWTLFITGRKVREWGFHCPQGWRHWQDFVSVRDGGNEVGRGCE